MKLCVTLKMSSYKHIQNLNFLTQKLDFDFLE